MSGLHRFATNQCLNIEMIKINRQRLNYQKDKMHLMDMSIQEAAVGRQIKSAESRTRKRHPQYKATNTYWKRADDSIKEQVKITILISRYNDSLLNNNDKREMENKKVITNLVNQPSPVKIGRKRSYNEMNFMNESSATTELDDDKDNEDNHENGVKLKLETIDNATQLTRVSKRGWKKRKRV